MFFAIDQNSHWCNFYVYILFYESLKLLSVCDKKIYILHRFFMCRKIIIKCNLTLYLKAILIKKSFYYLKHYKINLVLVFVVSFRVWLVGKPTTHYIFHCVTHTGVNYTGLEIMKKTVQKKAHTHPPRVWCGCHNEHIILVYFIFNKKKARTRTHVNYTHDKTLEKSA